MKLFRILFAGLLCVNPLGAQNPKAVPEAIAADKGSLDASGKFVPNTPEAGKGTPESREQDEAKLRASLQILPGGPDRYRIGEISFDRARRGVIIPARSIWTPACLNTRWWRKPASFTRRCFPPRRIPARSTWPACC